MAALCLGILLDRLASGIPTNRAPVDHIGDHVVARRPEAAASPIGELAVTTLLGHAKKNSW